MATTKTRAKAERAAWTEIRRLVEGQSCAYAAACEASGLTPPQAALMLKLAPGATYPMAALASALSCHASNVTGLVDRLEEQGLLERQPSAQDRRVKHIAMTPKGVERRDHLLERTYEAPGCFATLDASELSALTALVQRLRAPT